MSDGTLTIFRQNLKETRLFYSPRSAFWDYSYPGCHKEMRLWSPVIKVNIMKSINFYDQTKWNDLQSLRLSYLWIIFYKVFGLKNSNIIK